MNDTTTIVDRAWDWRDVWCRSAVRHLRRAAGMRRIGREDLCRIYLRRALAAEDRAIVALERYLQGRREGSDAA